MTNKQTKKEKTKEARKKYYATSASRAWLVLIKKGNEN